MGNRGKERLIHLPEVTRLRTEEKFPNSHTNVLTTKLMLC